MRLFANGLNNCNPWVQKIWKIWSRANILHGLARQQVSSDHIYFKVALASTLCCSCLALS